MGKKVKNADISAGGDHLIIMVSDYRVITSGQEVIAFLTYVREVKALTSSYLHNERKEGVFRRNDRENFTKES